jgi:protein subunit release factor A
MSDAILDETNTRVELLALDDRGGQKVGTGRFLIRLTHIPSGMSVTISDKRGQHRARYDALMLLQMMVEDHA